MRNNILVTGGAGYIGSHICKALALEGYTPIVYDNLIYGHDSSVKWGPLEIGDIADRTRLDGVIAKHKPTAVMHLAAFAYVAESVENPGKYYRNNVAGTLTLLEAMRDHEIDKLVFSSTCATYGDPQNTPITEKHPQAPVNPYGMSKLMVEQMLRDFGTAHGLKSIALRYFNAAGADPDGEIGEDHEPETHLIPLVLDVAIGKRAYITIFGDNYDTPDGTCIRDYIHVTDLAKAHVLSLQKLESVLASPPQSPSTAFNAFNLSNGAGFSVKEVIEVAEKVTGEKIPFRVGDRRPGDPAILVGSTTKIFNECGWLANYGDLKIIIDTAWQWLSNNRQ